MARKTKTDREYELLIEAIGEEITQTIPDKWMKILEHTVYEALMNHTIQELKNIQARLGKLPKFKHRYLESRFNVKPKPQEMPVNVEPAQPSLGGGY